MKTVKVNVEIEVPVPDDADDSWTFQLVRGALYNTSQDLDYCSHYARQQREVVNEEHGVKSKVTWSESQ